MLVTCCVAGSARTHPTIAVRSKEAGVTESLCLITYIVLVVPNYNLNYDRGAEQLFSSRIADKEMLFSNFLCHNEHCFTHQKPPLSSISSFFGHVFFPCKCGEALLMDNISTGTTHWHTPAYAQDTARSYHPPSGSDWRDASGGTSTNTPVPVQLTSSRCHVDFEKSEDLKQVSKLCQIASLHFTKAFDAVCQGTRPAYP
jgi:hypothetical protein